MELYEEGVIRIYDVLFPATVLLETDSYIRDFIVRSGLNEPIATSEFHYRLGLDLLERFPGCEEHSVVARAAKTGVPIYTSSPGDSSIGMNIAYHELMNGSRLMIDPNRDVNEICAIVLAGKQNGCVILGGGSPKNFYLQAQPTLWEVYGIPKGGNDYFIQITTDSGGVGRTLGRHARRSRELGQGESRRAAGHRRGLRRLDDRVPALLRVRRRRRRTARRPRKELVHQRDRLVAEPDAEAKAARDEERQLHERRRRRKGSNGNAGIGTRAACRTDLAAAAHLRRCQVPARLVAHMRQRLGWDVLFVLEEDELRRASDLTHYRLAQQLRRTLITIDKDYLDDGAFPPAEGSGVLVISAPDDRQYEALMTRIDGAVRSSAAAAPGCRSKDENSRCTPTGAGTRNDRPDGRRSGAARSHPHRRHADDRRRPHRRHQGRLAGRQAPRLSRSTAIRSFPASSTSTSTAIGAPTRWTRAMPCSGSRMPFRDLASPRSARRPSRARLPTSAGAEPGAARARNAGTGVAPECCRLTSRATSSIPTIEGRSRSSACVCRQRTGDAARGATVGRFHGSRHDRGHRGARTGHRRRHARAGDSTGASISSSGSRPGHQGVAWPLRRDMRAGARRALLPARATRHTSSTACRRSHHRAPGLAGAVLQSDEVVAEMICDGVHVHPALVRMVVAAKKASRVMAISDGTAAAALPPGAPASLGGQTIVAGDTCARLADGTMAGSTMTMDEAFRRLTGKMGVSMVDAATMCATTPARELGLVGHGGAGRGAVADLVVLDRFGSVVQTYVSRPARLCPPRPQGEQRPGGLRLSLHRARPGRAQEVWHVVLLSTRCGGADASGRPRSLGCWLRGHLRRRGVAHRHHRKAVRRVRHTDTDGGNLRRQRGGLHVGPARGAGHHRAPCHESRGGGSDAHNRRAESATTSWSR